MKGKMGKNMRGEDIVNEKGNEFGELDEEITDLRNELYSCVSSF